DLKQYGVTAADILHAKPAERFKELMQLQARRAESYYAMSFQALAAQDPRTKRPGLIMAAIYRQLLAEIERDGFGVVTQRTSLTPLRKFWIAWKTWGAA